MTTPPTAPTTPRCLRCAYALEGLGSPGECPECSAPFDLRDPSTYTLRPPFLRWKFWLPGLLLAVGAGTAVSAVLVFAFGHWTGGVWLGVPFMVGCLLGYRCRVRWYFLPLVGTAAGLGVILGLMSLQLAGIFCGLILAGIFLAPIFLGATFGALLRHNLKTGGFSQGGYLPVWAAIAVPLVWGAIEGRPAPMRPESITTTALMHAPSAQCWEAIVFFEDVEHPPPWILRVGLARPLSTSGRARAVGDVKVCIYNKGHITKRITEVLPHESLAFEIVEQRIGYERDVRLIGGGFHLEPAGDDATRITLTTTYEPKLGPRFCWRWAEARAVQLLHGHVLEGMRLRAERDAAAGALSLGVSP